MRKRAILATIPQRPQPRRPSCRRLDRRCKRPLQGFAGVTFGFWLRGGMGSDIRACVCSWIRSTGRGSGSVSSFGSSATIGTGYLAGDRTKREGRGRCMARGRSALASRHERGSSPPKLVRTEALTFFSEEEVARARTYHRPLYWAAAADVAIEASVLGALVWSGAGAALDPGSLPWWGRTPAYAAIVVAASASVRSPLALWSGFIRERRWGFSTQRLRSWTADRAKTVGVNIVLTAAALLGLVGLARALPGWWAAPAAAAFAFAA